MVLYVTKFKVIYDRIIRTIEFIKSTKLKV